MQMIEPPTTRVRESFLAAVAEATEAREMSRSSMMGKWADQFGDEWGSEAGFARFVAYLKADALPETPRPAEFVPQSTWWLVDGADYLGRISVRHRLTPVLLDQGGHIGYEVRPSTRQRGFATMMLAQVLPKAAHLGIDPVLVTCDTDNVASRRVIESNGGVLDDVRRGKRRYWVPTALGQRG